MYLNDWLYWDQPFMERLHFDRKADCIQGLHAAAKYYKVTRNFAKIDEDIRFEKAYEELFKIEKPNDNDEAVNAVLELSSSLKKIYGKNAISAASKFLWLRFKSPIIIYDSRAYECLKSRGYRIGYGNYKSYQKAWLNEFDKVEQTISLAAAELHTVKQYSQAYSCTDDLIIKFTSERWFRERVFDKYLWFLAGND